MKHSIVMPCLFRREEHLETVERCINTVKAFSSDYELIIIDDGSPLNTDFLKEAADVYIRASKPRGIAFGWNDGIRISRGEYITVINDDITACPNWLESMEVCLSGISVSAPGIEKLPAGQGIIENRVWFPGSCFMLNRETVKIVGYFDEQFAPFNYEDVDYWTRVYKSGGKLYRNYCIEVGHAEGQVIHNIENSTVVDSENRQKYLKKWGFDPIPVFYQGEKLPWE
jgi:glycosyltransferase involved in cell wall biosynthesis